MSNLVNLLPRKGHSQGYPISLVTLKTAPSYPSRDLQGLAPGHPEVYRLNPDLPRPPKCRGPASGSPGQDLGSGYNKGKTNPPCLLRNIWGPAPGHPEIYRVNPDLPRPPKRWGPASGSLGQDPVLDTLTFTTFRDPNYKNLRCYCHDQGQSEKNNFDISLCAYVLLE